jgi:hypothetical protein
MDGVMGHKAPLGPEFGSFPGSGGRRWRTEYGWTNGLLAEVREPTAAGGWNATALVWSQGLLQAVSDPLGQETEDQISFNLFNVGVPIKDIGVVAVTANLWDLGSNSLTNYGQGNQGVDNQSVLMMYGWSLTASTAAAAPTP